MQEQADDWMHSKVLGLLQNAQSRVARSLLGTALLSLECGEAMARYRGNPDDLRGQLTAVMDDYDRWAKWGKYGSRALALVPLALLGPFTIPMLAIAVVALVSYVYWTAADHVDRPGWVPFDAAPGVATVLGIPKEGYPGRDRVTGVPRIRIPRWESR